MIAPGSGVSRLNPPHSRLPNSILGAWGALPLPGEGNSANLPRSPGLPAAVPPPARARPGERPGGVNPLGCGARAASPRSSALQLLEEPNQPQELDSATLRQRGRGVWAAFSARMSQECPDGARGDPEGAGATLISVADNVCPVGFNSLLSTQMPTALKLTGFQFS